MPSTPRKDDKPVRPPSRTADSPSRSSPAGAEQKEAPRLTPEWLASMLLDVTAHLMNAIDRAAAGRLRRRMAIANAAIIVALAIAIPIGWHYGALSRVDEVTSYETASGAHRFVLGGFTYQVTRAQFEARLRPVDPEPIRKYSVEIGGRRYPVKQAVGVGLGAERATFSSGQGQALSILHKLGYQTAETQP